MDVTQEFVQEMLNKIHIKGAREHNLQNLDVEIPRDALVVISGVSGSGKSSLAFDTLYAEGYRKYMDSLSTRARQLLEQLPRPDIDFIEGLSPVVAIEQRTGSGNNPRSTVATITEVADYARLLWSVCGEAHCPEDGGRIVQRSLDDCLDRIFEEPEGSRIILVAPYLEGKPSVLRGELGHLQQRGYQRVRIDGEIREIDDPDVLPSGNRECSLEIVIDRIILREDQRSRLADSLELAFREGGNRALVLSAQDREGPWKSLGVSQHLTCENCGKVYPQLTSRHFSWDHPEGACPCCGGLGQTLQFAESLLVPDPAKSLKKGAIKPWRLGSKRMIIQRNAILKQLAEQYPFDPDTPWKDLPEKVQRDILYGTGERKFLFKTKPGNTKPVETTFEGVIEDLEKTRRETRSDGLRHRLMAYQVKQDCPECNCQRLAAYPRSVKLGEVTFPDFMFMDLAQAHAFVKSIKYPNFRDAIDGLESRLRFLNQVGLHYLSLDRPYDSLSGGESQRVRLATQLGMGLVGVAYVLDEPTIGLHPANTRDLIKTLQGLRERGNAVIVVEHDPEVIEAADNLIEIGPGAGAAGGRLVFQGTPGDAKKSSHSQTGRFLSGKAKVESHGERKLPGQDWLTIEDAYEHNLRHIDVSLPLGCLSVVTGVSGSGKSTLVNDILGRAAAFKLNRAKEIPGRHRQVKGLENFYRVVRVDQEAIGRSPRSNPATYTKILDDLRRLFSLCPLAKVRGYNPGRFSFNVKGGRCERCRGDGVIKLDMQFLNDVFAECPSCRGKRFNRETLEVRFKGYNIADVLDMTVDEALELFQNQPSLYRKLETLQAVGLGYLHLGQPAPTLSGGEAQRLKLSLELSKGHSDPCLYILDEPTTGLHWVDIQYLMDLLFRLRDQGHTLVVIEHNLDVIRLADWIVDLGPGGGKEGGELLFNGPAGELTTSTKSLTAGYIKNVQ